jgi:hypothetical protein
LSATILAAVFLAFSGGFLELEFPAYVFRRFQTAANISVQIYFPPKISGGFETAANPSVQIFISRFVSGGLEPPQNLPKPPQMYFFII